MRTNLRARKRPRKQATADPTIAGATANPELSPWTTSDRETALTDKANHGRTVSLQAHQHELAWVLSVTPGVSLNENVNPIS